MAAQVRRLLIAAALLLLAAAGCGADESGGGSRSDRLVDFKQRPPFVNSLIAADDGSSFLLTTNRGFWRIEDGKARRLRGTLTAKEGSSPVGTFLEIDQFGPQELVGSGHPDNPRPLPPYLGFLRSTDGGRTWSVVSRLGEADLHQIRRLHDRIYAFDAVLGAMLVSTDQGKTWKEKFTPRQLVLDFVVDPEDPEVILASTEKQLYRTKDGGDSWRPAGQAAAPRLDWPTKDVVMRADKDGLFQVSADGGQTWERRGRIDGEPYEVVAKGPERAFIALSDGTILETTDGGRTFKARFRP